MTVGVVIPFRSDDPHRLRLRGWCMARLSCQLRGLDHHIVISGDFAETGPFNRARAVNHGVAVLDDCDVLVIADADVLVSTASLQLAVSIARKGQWVIPYTDYCWVDEPGTDFILGGPVDVEPVVAPSRVLKRFTAQTEPVNRFGGSVCGVVVLPRSDFERVGGYDERFVGWGWEDTSLAAALWTMVGEPMRTPLECFHLWHPLDPRRFRNHRSRALGKRYTDAMGDPVAMGALLGEERSR